jgi:hypothetical protein
MSLVKKLEELIEEPHPFLKSVGIRTLYSKKEDRGDVQLEPGVFVSVPKGLRH